MKESARSAAKDGTEGAAKDGAAGVMKAAVYRRYGPPDVVTISEVPKPVPRGDEVLVRIRAATVGIVDSLARQGTPYYARTHFGLRRPRFACLGSDFAGQIEAVGPDVTRFARRRRRLRHHRAPVRRARGVCLPVRAGRGGTQASPG